MRNGKKKTARPEKKLLYTNRNFFGSSEICDPKPTNQLFLDFFNGKRTVSLKDLLLQASKLKPKELERRKDVAECQKLDTGNENKKKADSRNNNTKY